MAGGQKRIFVTRLTDRATTDVEGIGTIRDDGNKTYKWVKYNDGGVNVLQGDFVHYGTDGSYTNGDYVASNTAGQAFATGVSAGVVASATAAADGGAITKGTYMWIQIRGIVTVNTLTGPPSNGQLCTGFNAASAALKVVAALTDHSAGVVVESGNKIVDLLCPY